MTLFPLGAYVGNPNGSSAAGESQFQADYIDFATAMGVQPKFLDLYVDQMKPVSEWVGNAQWQAWSASLSPVARSLTPVIGFPMASGASGSPTPDQFYKDFASGQYDSVISGVIRQYAQMGFTVQYWRPGWEFNLNGQPHYAGDDPATQADWVKAFQHIANVMHAAGAAIGVTVNVIWNPSVTNYTNAKATANLYPGDSYVDVIAADVYSDLHPYADGPGGLIYDWDKSGQVLNSPNPIFSTLQQWASSAINLEHYYEYPASGRWGLDQSNGHALTLDALISFAKAHGKMFAVAETGAGATSDGAGVSDNAVFVKWLNQALINSAAQVAFVNVWDSNGGSNYAFSAASDGKPNEAAAWKTYFGSGSVADTTPPAVTLALSSDSGASASDKVTSHAGLAGSGDANATVTISSGNLILGTTTADGQGHWSFTPTNLADGNYTLTASEIDAVGNTGSTTQAIVLDTTAPVVTIELARDTGSSSSDKITSFAGLVGSGDANATVTISNGALVLGTTTGDSQGHWSLTPNSLADGSYTLTAKEVDAAGNGGTATLSFSFDTTAPATTIGLANDTGSSNSDRITSSASLKGSGDAGATVTIRKATTVLGTTTADNAGNWSFSPTGLAEGGSTLTATETDTAGNGATATITITRDTIAPKPTITTITGNTDGGLTLVGTSEANSTVTVIDTSNGKTATVGTALTGNNGAWSMTSHVLVDATKIHSYSASMTDIAGNPGTMPGSFYLASTGRDTLTGNANVSDIFAIMSFKGSDIITGFQTSSAVGAYHDYINFSGRGISSFSQIQSKMSGITSAIIDLGFGKTITIANVAASTLTAADFRYS